MKHLIALLAISAILQNVYSQNNHIINLEIDVEPSSAVLNVRAMIYVNNKFATDAPADNTPVHKIYKQIPGNKQDSLKIKIVVFQPSGYVCAESNPFAYTSGDFRKLLVVRKDLAATYLLNEGAGLMTNRSYSKVIDLYQSAIDQSLPTNIEDEIKLKVGLAEAYARTNEDKKQSEILNGISIYDLNSVDTALHKRYFKDLIVSFIHRSKTDTTKENWNDLFANQIYQNDTLFHNWHVITSKFLSSRLSQSSDLIPFSSPLQTNADLKAQFDILTNRVKTAL